MKTYNEHMGQYAWDMMFTDGETIREMYLDLYDRIDTICCVNIMPGDEQPYIICNKMVASALIVLEGMEFKYGRKVAFDFKYEQRDDCMYVGYTKLESSKVRSGFHIYEDENAPKDQILICVGDRRCLLNLYNYIGS